MRVLCYLIFFVSTSVVQIVRADDMVVVASTSPAIKTGTLLAVSQRIELFPGESITVVSKFSDRIKLEGPYEGTISLNNQQENDGILQVLADLFLRQEKEIPGAFRKFTPTQIGASEQSIWDMDIRKNEIFCVPVNQKPGIWRPETKGESHLLILKNDKILATVLWPEDFSSIQWPDNVKIEDNQTYQFEVKKPFVLSTKTVRLMPVAIENKLDIAIWLANNQCDRQSIKVLENL